MTAATETRCLACLLDRHHQCVGDPCGCTRHWPSQRQGDPFQLPYALRAAEGHVPAPREPEVPLPPEPSAEDDGYDDEVPF